MDENFEIARLGKYSERVLGDMVEVWRTLKALTKGDAREIVTSVRNQDGFEAWKNLVQFFEKAWRPGPEQPWQTYRA